MMHKLTTVCFTQQCTVVNIFIHCILYHKRRINCKTKVIGGMKMCITNEESMGWSGLGQFTPRWWWFCLDLQHFLSRLTVTVFKKKYDTLPRKNNVSIQITKYSIASIPIPTTTIISVIANSETYRTQFN